MGNNIDGLPPSPPLNTSFEGGVDAPESSRTTKDGREVVVAQVKPTEGLKTSDDGLKKTDIKTREIAVAKTNEDKKSGALKVLNVLTKLKLHVTGEMNHRTPVTFLTKCVAPILSQTNEGAMDKTPMSEEVREKFNKFSDDLGELGAWMVSVQPAPADENYKKLVKQFTKLDKQTAEDLQKAEFKNGRAQLGVMAKKRLTESLRLQNEKLPAARSKYMEAWKIQAESSRPMIKLEESFNQLEQQLQSELGTKRLQINMLIELKDWAKTVLIHKEFPDGVF